MKKKQKIIIPIAVLTVLICGYFIADSILFNGVRPRAINESDFQANYFSKNRLENQTAVILLGGGQWGDYWAQYFAQNDMVGLSIPYAGRENLPRLPEEINLEYFENAINWLAEQPEVNPKKIVVMGASKNAELALVIGTIFNELVHGVVAYSPSSVSWSNRVLPYNSDELKASWKYKGLDIPYVPMDKIKSNQYDQLNMLEYWEMGLEKSGHVAAATIKVERINGPILLISGRDDQVWPSSKMADMIEKRLSDKGFEYSCINLKYDQAGHSISTNPDNKSSHNTGTITINGKDYTYEFGGNPNGIYSAKQDARNQLMRFLRNI